MLVQDANQPPVKDRSFLLQVLLVCGTDFFNFRTEEALSFRFSLKKNSGGSDVNINNLSVTDQTGRSSIKFLHLVTSEEWTTF